MRNAVIYVKRCKSMGKYFMPFKTFDKFKVGNMPISN